MRFLKKKKNVLFINMRAFTMAVQVGYSCLAKEWGWTAAAAGRPGELLLQEAHHAYQTLDVEPDKIKYKIST